MRKLKSFKDFLERLRFTQITDMWLSWLWKEQESLNLRSALPSKAEAAIRVATEQNLRKVPHHTACPLLLAP